MKTLYYRVVTTLPDGTDLASGVGPETTSVSAVIDFAGDGKDDIATFARGTAGDVYVALSNSARLVGNSVKWHDNFAFWSELPAVGDFTGDGKADIVTYMRGARGDVYVGSSDGTKFVGASALWHGDFAFSEEVTAPRSFALGF
ncbi:FG-GAP repeat domain-containing protein [Amycolatopsis alba]|uniref:FG-GAP repeat domain-containing protein n=1 Tax=Amycolatopsis alba TaxID=76020 RepID=UPI0003754291|nr:VCBS repeat-containing protein [Amycolatopsis alba]